jgi:hypothetical protein
MNAQEPRLLNDWVQTRMNEAHRRDGIDPIIPDILLLAIDAASLGIDADQMNLGPRGVGGGAERRVNQRFV